MEIKVCGIGVVSAIGMGCDENLRSLRSEKCGIGPLTLFDTTLNFPVGQADYSNKKLKAQLRIDERQTISRTALLGAVAAQEALKDAQIPAGNRIALISSTSVGGMDLTEQFYPKYNQNPSSGRLRYIAGHDCATSTEFIAHQCGITGFRTTISTACSSAANAIIMGAELLKRGMADYVVAGGTDALCKFTLNGFNSLMILDKELCRPLDRDRKGLNLGEGAGYVVLTTAQQATKSYCTLSGYANANDAHHQTASSEDGEGAYLAMKMAMQMASIAPGDIDYINLHGTGTDNNDMSELAAVKRIFGKSIPPFSSTKSFTGHTLAAAGGVEAVFSILAIAHDIVYANLRFQNPLGDGFIPVTKTITGGNVNSVLTNSFGFGGNCSSLLFSR